MKRRENLVARAWRGDIPWYQSVVVMLVAALAATVLVGFGVNAARGDPVHPNICRPGNPDPDVPCNADQFVRNFNRGDYGRTVALTYSRAFKKFFMFKVHQHADANPGFVPCPGSPDLGCTWDQYTKHDSCAVSSLPDTFDADSCRASHGLKGLLDSPYWTKRGETQTKWEGRIVWCGTVAVVALFFRASPGAAVGSGSGVCLGGRLVP